MRSEHVCSIVLDIAAGFHEREHGMCSCWHSRLRHSGIVRGHPPVNPRRTETANASGTATGGGRLSRLVCVAVLLLGLVSPAIAADVEIVVSEESGAYIELADALQHELRPHTARRSVAAAVQRAAAGTQPPDLVLAVGTRALAAALKTRNSPIIASLVPRHAFEQALREANVAEGRPVTAVYLDQPYARQLNLVRLTLPDRHRIGVLLGPEREEELTLLRAAALPHMLVVIAETVPSSETLYEALARVLAESDLVLALPDSSIYTTSAIQNILMATYRAQRPLFGFSAAQVRAGALTSVYSTSTQIARQVADMALRFLAGSALPQPEYPRSFSVDFNFTVARALGIATEDPATLEAKLRALEREP